MVVDTFVRIHRRFIGVDFAYSIAYTGRFKISKARGINFLIKNIKYSSYEYDPYIGKSFENFNILSMKK